MTPTTKTELIKRVKHDRCSLGVSPKHTNGAQDNGNFSKFTQNYALLELCTYETK